MNEPTFDRNGYPTDETLLVIEKWNSDWPAWFEYIIDVWNLETGNTICSGERVELITGDWSGNESIIGAMRRNIVGWSMCWKSSRRGGQYEFEVPK